MTIRTKALRLTALAMGTTTLALPSGSLAQPLATVERNGGIVSIEAYAANIVHVTIALDRVNADAAPGFGISGKVDASGWRHRAEAGGDVFSSPELTITVAAKPWPKAPTQMERYFAPSLPPVSIAIAAPGGQQITQMTGWEMAPQTVNGEKTFKVGATFSDTPDTHYYGLGQNQEGMLDLRGHTIDCRHWYDAPAGEQVCVPFLVTDKGYGIVWDNPSATTVSPGLHNSTRIQSEVGERVSFFIITGRNANDLYAGYRRLTGITPLPPKSAFGLIQSKARYETQQELLDVADGYRRRGYPLDMMVLDWFSWTRMGQLDTDRTYFPDPNAMNDKLHAMGMRSIISVWPRFERASRYYDQLAAKGWFLHDKDGNPIDGLPVRSDRAGALIDSTNSDARRWFWNTVNQNILGEGFDFLWLDETEPDLVPTGHFYSIGSGDRYHNVFPLFHLGGAAEGSARDRPPFRDLLLGRAAYLGSQASGAIFWTSDINSTWEALRRQVPANLNMAASGIAYTSSDTGGWQWPTGPKALHAPLVDPAGAISTGTNYPDYPELFVRWFELNSLTPTLRIHGQRPGSLAIWDYGPAAEPILASWLRLRYSLIPYLYSLGHETYRTGAPFMRALWMDFPGDPKVKAIADQYMLGPAFLVAPVTEQGATSRSVYLPDGSDWYDWWTGSKFTGGQTIIAAAPIERIPLYVKAGSIVPIGVQIPSTATAQKLERIRVYPGRNASFQLYDDDGTTNAYKADGGRSVTLRWDDQAGKLIATGKLPTGQNPAAVLEVIKR